MSLAALKAAGPIAPRKGPGCTMGTLLRSLPENESRALTLMLDDDDWQSEGIAKAVTSEVGVKLRGHTVARHRRGLCACEDAT